MAAGWHAGERRGDAKIRLVKVLILILVLVGIAACVAVSGWIVTGGHLRWRAARGKPAPTRSRRATAVTIIVAIVLVVVGIVVENQR